MIPEMIAFILVNLALEEAIRNRRAFAWIQPRNASKR